MRTPLYPKILVEGRYAPRNDTNNLYDSLIDAPDSIDHPDIRWDPLDRCRCLHRIKCNVSGGAKIERSGGTVPQLTKTGKAIRPGSKKLAPAGPRPIIKNHPESRWYSDQGYSTRNLLPPYHPDKNSTCPKARDSPVGSCSSMSFKVFWQLLWFVDRC